ncbi:unnamed protein product [Gongylonema pulchrum]|uniref:Uncharacterized protein n=1 Tax=Gongylonema pulchrum TaxID=637853 RepID=A0A183E8C3_9BILA|nr:unnamed protein product [Gongylonema pulchrum]
MVKQAPAQTNNLGLATESNSYNSNIVRFRVVFDSSKRSTDGYRTRDDRSKPQIWCTDVPILFRPFHGCCPVSLMAWQTGTAISRDREGPGRKGVLFKALPRDQVSFTGKKNNIQIR